MSMHDDSGQYAIVSLYNGYTDVALVRGVSLAIRALLQEARILADLFPDEEIKFLGQDIDGGLPNIAMTIDDVVMVCLQQPKIIDGKIVRNEKLVDAKPVALPGIDEEATFTGMGIWLSWVFSDRDGKDTEERRNRAMNSWPAMRLSRDYSEVLNLASKESLNEIEPPEPSGDKNKLLKAIDSIRLSYSATATVR